MNKKFWSALALSAALAGCSSVSLQEGQVPVEDRTGTATGADAAARTDAGAEGRAATQSRVAPVAVDNSALLAAGPAGVGRRFPCGPTACHGAILPVLAEQMRTALRAPRGAATEDPARRATAGRPR